MVNKFFENELHEVVTVQQLEFSTSTKIAEVIQSDEYNKARLVECRCSSDKRIEGLVIDLQVDLGQRELVNDIRLWEPVVILVARDILLPQVYPLREDFPFQVPHFHVAPREIPNPFCLYDGLIEDVIRVFTPLKFLERTRWWLKETAYDRLHGENQPLDPIFAHSTNNVIMLEKFDKNEFDFLFAYVRYEHRDCPVILCQKSPQEIKELLKKNGRKGIFVSVVIKTAPVRHGRIQWLPQNLKELLEVYKDFGCDIRELLLEQLNLWSGNPELSIILSSPLLVLIQSPILSSTGKIEAETNRAYFSCDSSAKDVLAALQGNIEISGGHFGHIIGQSNTPNENDLRGIKLDSANVYKPFDRELAKESSGTDNNQIKNVVQIGAGALGSQLSLFSAQRGYGKWTIIDYDFLYPHNLARHGLNRFWVGSPKAKGVSIEIEKVLGLNSAQALVEDVMECNIDPNLSRADEIIDCSAAVKVSRWLSRQDSIKARCVSAFLNPKGTDLVLLSEGRDRVTRLDHIEMTYYWLLVNEPMLREHLTEGSTIYPGSCRSPSVQIPQTNVAASAAIASDVICEENCWTEEGAIQIWKRDDSCWNIHYMNFSGSRYLENELGEWTVVINEQVMSAISDAREKAGSFETGGILIGCWDRESKRLYIVGNCDPPPDSVCETTGFVRGSIGVYKTITEVELNTAGNLTYIGEWHTHPRGVDATPSADDQFLLRWIADALKWSDAPALMLIGGENGTMIILGSDSPKLIINSQLVAH